MAIGVERKFNYKIGGIVAIAVVVSIVGTLAITSFQTNIDVQTQSIGIGAFVTVKAYHEDGTLFQKWEGHNDLFPTAQNALVGCITGLDTTPLGYASCDLSITELKLRVISEADSSSETIIGNPIISLIPEGCDTNNTANLCSGWTMDATFDFNTLVCTPTVDCVKAKELETFRDGGFSFNAVFINPEIPIVPNDRLVVTMDFDVPA